VNVVAACEGFFEIVMVEEVEEVEQDVAEAISKNAAPSPFFGENALSPIIKNAPLPNPIRAKAYLLIPIALLITCIIPNKNK
jgi:hypothetical protein